MIKKTVLTLFFATGCLALMSSATTYAQGNCNCLGRSAIRSGNTIIAPRPPYFAMHPPVYYDRVVSRAYGISPFAVPPGVMPVENSIPVAPKSVSNPFFKKGKPASAKQPNQVIKSSKQAKGKPSNKITAKRIENPFYFQKVVSAN